jgi:hypothetical protein
MICLSASLFLLISSKLDGYQVAKRLQVELRTFIKDWSLNSLGNWLEQGRPIQPTCMAD